MPEAFREFFRTVDVGDRGHHLGLSSRRCRAVSRAVRAGSDGRGGNRQPHPPGRAAGSGVRTGQRVHSKPAGPTYVSAYRRSGGMPPLIVAVSLHEGRDPVRLAASDSDVAHGIRRAHAHARADGARAVSADGRAERRFEQELGDVQRLEAARLRETNERLEEALEREQRARRETRSGELSEGRIPDDRLARAAHAADRDLRVGAHARGGRAARTISGAGRSPPSSGTRARRRGSSTICSTCRARSAASCGSTRVRSTSRMSCTRPSRPSGPRSKRSRFDSIRRSTPRSAPSSSIRIACSRSSGTCCRTRSSSRRTTARSVWRCADASSRHRDRGVRHRRRNRPGLSARTSSSGFARPTPARGAATAASGLGLAIVRHLVELHGGTVRAESGGEWRRRDVPGAPADTSGPS